MNLEEPDNTIKEILEDDRTEVRKRKRGKGCFLRLLIIIVVVFIGLYGFILFRQRMLDLEAEAVIRARQTINAEANPEAPADEPAPAPSSPAAEPSAASEDLQPTAATTQ